MIKILTSFPQILPTFCKNFGFSYLLPSQSCEIFYLTCQHQPFFPCNFSSSHIIHYTSANFTKKTLVYKQTIFTNHTKNSSETHKIYFKIINYKKCSNLIHFWTKKCKNQLNIQKKGSALI